MMDLMVQVRERYEAVIREICHNEDCMQQALDEVVKGAYEMRTGYESVHNGYENLLNGLGDALTRSNSQLEQHEFGGLYQLNEYLHWYCGLILEDGHSPYIGGRT